jgi:hypothetical protein
MLREKSFRLCRGSNLDRPVVQPVACHYTDWATRLTIKQIVHKITTTVWSVYITPSFHSVCCHAADVSSNMAEVVDVSDQREG